MDRKPPATSLAWLWSNGSLTILMFGIFAICWSMLLHFGWKAHNQDLQEHGRPQLSLGQYFMSGHLWEATTENWEGEFLPMAAFTFLTAKFVQKGSPESRKPDEVLGPVAQTDDSPWPTHRGGIVLWLYEYSLTLALLTLFLISLCGHAWAGAKLESEDAIWHGQPAVSVGQFVASSQFWFQSFQNFQSEFLANGAMVVLAIFLRQKGSPESKRVNTPTWEDDD